MENLTNSKGHIGRRAGPQHVVARLGGDGRLGDGASRRIVEHDDNLATAASVGIIIDHDDDDDDDDDTINSETGAVFTTRDVTTRDGDGGVRSEEGIDAAGVVGLLHAPTVVVRRPSGLDDGERRIGEARRHLRRRKCCADGRRSAPQGFSGPPESMLR